MYDKTETDITKKNPLEFRASFISSESEYIETSKKERKKNKIIESSVVLKQICPNNIYISLY